MRSNAKAASALPTHRESGMFSLGGMAAMLACAAAFLGIGAPAANAAPEAGPGWGFKANFGSLSGQQVGTPATPIAVGGNGYVYAGEASPAFEATNGVSIFKPDEGTGGEFLTRMADLEYMIDIAVDPVTNAVYADTVSYVSGNIRRWTSDGAAIPTYTIDPSFEVPRGAGIAVDPTNQDLLVADPEAEAVRRYDTSGTLVATIGTPSISPFWLQALPDGSFYVAPASGPNLTHFSGTGTLLGTIAGVGSLHGLSYDPVRSLIVASVGDQLRAYSTAGTLLAESTTQGEAGIGTVVSATGLLYEHVGFSVNVYSPGIVPGVEAPIASNITPFEFHIDAEVDPGEEGGTVPDGSTVHFEYRLAGTESWTATGDQAADAPGAYGADISGLEPNTEYEVRVVASNSVITKRSAVTKVSSAVSAPAIVTGDATDVSETSAVLNGTINPFGLQTNYYFEYGTTTAYGSRIPAGIEAVAGGGRVPALFSRIITGLTPGTTYHFRLVATNSAGTAEGSDRTFSTVPAGDIPLRTYEQVTPADKQGAAIIPRLAIQASADGNGLTYTTKTASESSPILSRSVAIRGSTDWGGKIDTDPPLNALSNGFVVHPTLALSADYKKALVVSNRVLTPGEGFENGANIYIKDLASGTYEFIGASNANGAFNDFAKSSSSGTYIAGAEDFSWVIFSSIPPLLPGAPNYALYRWSETGGFEVLSTLPNGEPTSAMRASVEPIYHIVSADGSRIYYTAFGGAEEGIFMRDGSGASKPISVSHVPGDPATARTAILFGVTPDGRYAFFTSKAKLTSDAPQHAKPIEDGPNLYRYDAADDSLKYLGVEAYSSPNDPAPGLNTGSLGIGADGNTVYFLETNSSFFKENLAVWHEGAVHSVASISPEGREQRASPNGRYYVFAESDGALRLYDAVTNETSCVSCLADGTPVPASSTEATGGDLLFSNRGTLAVSDDGTVYFDTAGRLVAADVNGTRDVYSYRDGIRRLISPGNRPFDAIYADATADGSNVFFTTAQKLVGRDNDESIDVYDARVNGGLPVQNPPPPHECLRDDCKATPNAGPELPFGGSEALSGPENVKPAKHKKCGKGKRAKKVKGKVRCVKKHTKHKAGKNKKGGSR